VADTIKVTIVETGPPGPAGPIGPTGPAGGGGGGGAVVSPTEPTSAVAGDMWYNPDDDELFIYNVNIGQWEQIPFVSDFSDPGGTLIIEGGGF